MKNTKDWTVMIFMAGDNNLSIEMAYTLEELQKKVVKTKNERINLFVYYENNSPEIPSIYCNFSDAENPTFQYSNEIGNKFSNIQLKDVTNSKAIYPVLDFVDWCEKSSEQKADNYALIFSGHTMGFLSMGLLKDESKNVSMTLPNLLTGLETITNEIIGQKLAVLGFDSCVMSMFEVGQQFKNVAETMIASEGTMPNAGWSYAEVLGNLTNSEKDVKTIAGQFVQKYIEKQSRYSIGGVSVDMTAWDLQKLDSLNEKLGRLAKNLLRCFGDKKNIIYHQMKRILLQVHYNSQTYMYEQSVDLGDFCSLLLEELASLENETGKKLNSVLRDVFESAKNVLSEISKCVILSGFSGGAFQFSNGISLFFPWSLAAYSVSLKDYKSLKFVNDTKAGKLWNEFLYKYLTEVSRRKSLEISDVTKPTFKHIPNVQSQTVLYEHKIPLHPLSKIPLHPLSKIPTNSLEGLNSESGKFFENFVKFKNIESKWNVMGYTKKIKAIK